MLRGSGLARMGSRSSGSHARCGHEVWAVRLDLNHAAGVGKAWRARWWERLARYLGKKGVIMSPSVVIHLFVFDSTLRRPSQSATSKGLGVQLPVRSLFRMVYWIITFKTDLYARP